MMVVVTLRERDRQHLYMVTEQLMGKGKTPLAAIPHHKVYGWVDQVFRELGITGVPILSPAESNHSGVQEFEVWYRVAPTGYSLYRVKTKNIRTRLRSTLAAVAAVADREPVELVLNPAHKELCKAVLYGNGDEPSYVVSFCADCARDEVWLRNGEDTDDWTPVVSSLNLKAEVAFDEVYYEEDEETEEVEDDNEV